MNNRTIFVIDDSADDRDLIARQLEKHTAPGTVTLFADGVEALKHLTGTDAEAVRLPAVIFLDLRMPRLDGFDVLRRVRENPRTRTVPVVILTSSSQDEDISRSYDLGANGYVRKPIDHRDFSDAMKTLSSFWLQRNEYPAVSLGRGTAAPDGSTTAL